MRRQPISWLFDPHCTAGVKENPRGDFKGMLSTADNHDLTWVAVHCTSGFEVRGNRLAERLETERSCILQLTATRPSAMTPDDARPRLVRKFIKSRLAHGERPQPSYPRKPLVPRKAQCKARNGPRPRWNSRVISSSMFTCGDLIGKGATNKGPRANARLKITLGQN